MTRTGPIAVAGALAAVVAGILAGAAFGEPAMLKLPFALPSAVAGADPATCPDESPPPVLRLSVASRYDRADKTRSKIDEAADLAYQAAMKPVRIYLARVTSAAGKHVASGGRDRTGAACALKLLTRWAHADALSHLDTRQSVLSVTRVVAGLALAYAEVKGSEIQGPADRAAIDDWLGGLATRIMAAFTEDGSGPVSNRQNHRYWAGFAVAAVGVATGSRTDLDWAVESFRIGVRQVTPAGALPLELARGPRARDYQLHATAPLVMIAELAAANGIDAYGMEGGAIHRLVAFDLTAMRDPSQVEALSGARQVDLPTRDGALRSDRVAWLAPYLARFPDRRREADGLALPERMASTLLGGTLSQLH